MSETPLQELARRFRYMIEMNGYGIDNSGDQTRKSEWIVGRRWVCGNVIGIVQQRTGVLDLRHWGGQTYIQFMYQDADGRFFNTPKPEHTQRLLKVLRTLMVLEELADV